MLEVMPKVSVIVPVYNVERYLEECLDSLVSQTLTEIEVIMVNDGSTDSSGKIMDEYAAEYPNFKAYHKANGGLGHARNYGVPFASGEYLVFIDSDDYVTRNAYRKMYETALETGSDIVIGNVKRFNSTKEFASGLHKKVFKETILNTHITKNPELLYDTTAWNKLFKKSFWDKHQFKFPEGILYEDLPVTIPAHFLSSSTDVLEDVIYFWRARDGGDKSITQQRNVLVNFTDRLKVLRMVDAFFDKRDIQDELRANKDYKALSLDILLYLNELDKVDDTFMDVFFDEVSAYLEDVSPQTIDRLNAIDRLKYHFIKQGNKEKLLEILHFQKTKMKNIKVIKKGSDYYGDYPYRAELPEELYKMTDELQPVMKIESVLWQDSKLIVNGYNYISKVDMKKKGLVSLNAYLLNPETMEKVEVPAEMAMRKDITFKKGIRISKRRPLKRLYNYDWSGYEVEIDFTDPKVIGLGKGRLELWFTLKVDNIEREFRAGNPVAGKKPRPSYNTGLGQRIFPKYNRAWNFVIQADVLSSVIDEVATKGNLLTIKGQSVYDLAEIQFVLVNYSKGEKKYYPLSSSSVKKQGIDLVANEFEVTVPIDSLYDEESRNEWISYIEFEEELMPLTVPNYIEKSSTPYGQREFHIQASPAGNLALNFRQIAPYLEETRFIDNQLYLKTKINQSFFGGLEKIDEVRLYLKHASNGNEYVIPYKTYDDEASSNRFFEGNVNLLSDTGIALFEVGTWRAYMEISGFWDEEFQVIKKRVMVDKSRYDFEENIASGIKLVPFRTTHDGFSIKSVLHWDWIERGPRRQEIIRKVLYPLMRLLPMNKKTVVFESFWNKSYSDNPRAIYEEMEQSGMDYNYVWFFNNENTEVNGRAKSIRKNSWKYYYYLATAKYFVNNVNFPDFYEKRNGAVEVQTLHGTPLKTMGIDVPGEVDTEAKMNNLLRRCGRWDYLISTSDYVTDLTRRCFVYKNEMLEVGFPRNDKLFREDNADRITQLKVELGIPLDKKIVLYAPTWRVKKNFKLELDLQRMQEELREDYVVLLRLHYLVGNSIDVSLFKGFAYNFSTYSDIQDLYLVSDALITDYSSVMFDYAILNRPMIFFTYDLELYRDQLRGMYIDFEKEAPGPLDRTTEDIIESIKGLNQHQEKYDEKMDKFRQTYCQFDDGQASKNVIKQVFK
ncbi:bifunctional glycosyltransferase/CDP-glycerol:glycerophosphate glycerophosphotransferase [Cytobacillus purgationiresistens]|uniref:CDP-glycerol glycerophosphotransferase n=1 Tax=Cytobacillus purgationiresistens TaxID=863449 RepID=A0ABU0AGA0_9BACI|nr:bifunctional glycosyltransferase/CDP-glycerol:glycerophosphate glycerophosphotransferase [Cytobacillus purgationiresistens]MDQ0269120.1 CDP-glycerol glycerophosphotransferase [Cytobacillus purgationiresistens]